MPNLNSTSIAADRDPSADGGVAAGLERLATITGQLDKAASSLHDKLDGVRAVA